MWQQWSCLGTSVHVWVASAGYSCCSDRSVSTGTAGWINYTFCIHLCVPQSCEIEAYFLSKVDMHVLDKEFLI